MVKLNLTWIKNLRVRGGRWAQLRIAHGTSKAALLQLRGTRESPGSIGLGGAGNAALPTGPQVRLMLVGDYAEYQGSELLVIFNFSVRVGGNGCAFSLN